MLAIAHTMASHTGLASPLFSVNEHGGWLAKAARLYRDGGGAASVRMRVFCEVRDKVQSSGLSSSTSSCVVRLRRNATQRSAKQPLGCSVAESQSQCRRGRLAAVGLQGRQGKGKTLARLRPRARRGLETKRVAGCTAYRVIAGGSARPKTSVQDAEDSESKPKRKHHTRPRGTAARNSELDFAKRVKPRSDR